MQVASGDLITYAFLDNAASTPAMVAAANAVAELLPWYASIHRGAGLKSRVATVAYEEARSRIARFLSVGQDHVVILTKSATEGLNRLARMFGDHRAIVFTSIMEHHANLLPWRLSGCELRYVQADAYGVLDEEDLRRQLLGTSTARPRIVSIAGVYNVSGYAPPVHHLARMAHENGAEIIVDAAQLVAHRPLAVRGVSADDELDYVVFSGHKVYAPFGSGVLIARRSTVERAQPNIVGGGIVDLVTLDDVVWNSLPDREEAGSPNVLGAVAIGAAMERLEILGRQQLAAEEQSLTSYAMRHLNEVPGLRILGPPDGPDRTGVVSFVLGGLPHGLVAAALSHEYGIGVRSGCFCAHPGVMHLLAEPPAVAQLHLDQMRAHEHCSLPGAVRVSLGIQNSEHDIRRLSTALLALSQDGARCQYEVNQESGEYMPALALPMPTLPLSMGAAANSSSV
ncbi:MAG TPA: aminotransferase class V-fold PLP-dependent enzyme [Candidatus Micrarchaeaceae archaeon]|nr:aminotransferase class V-fold PLP-dependent enzyme [Candidatus Micrarchaeaceae archaeon]